MATETDKVNTAALATLVAVGTFATISIVLGVDALVRYESNKVAAERASHASEGYHGLVAKQTAELAAPGKVVDPAKGIATMPIDQAIGGVIADLARDPQSASPAPAAAPSASAPTGELGATTPEGTAPAAPASAAPAPAAPSASAAAVPKKAPAPKAPAPTAAASVSPKAPQMVAVPPAAPAVPPRAPAPAAPAPSDG